MVASYFLFLLSFLVALPAKGVSIPERPKNSLTGVKFLESTFNLPSSKRERKIYRAIAGGNIPNLCRQFTKVPVSIVKKGGKKITAYFEVSNGLLAVGSDDNFVTMPMGLKTAVALGRTLRFVLPTRQLVKAIARSAHIVPAITLPPGPKMTSSEYFLQHHKRVFPKLQPLGKKLLLAGYKKNLILTTRLYQAQKKVAIFGWKHASGRFIQPISTVHGEDYADYSHGVRMVSETIWIKSQPRSIYDVAKDPDLSALVSDEGPIDLKGLMNGALSNIFL